MCWRFAAAFKECVWSKDFECPYPPMHVARLRQQLAAVHQEVFGCNQQQFACTARLWPFVVELLSVQQYCLRDYTQGGRVAAARLARLCFSLGTWCWRWCLILVSVWVMVSVAPFKQQRLWRSAKMAWCSLGLAAWFPAMLLLHQAHQCLAPYLDKSFACCYVRLLSRGLQLICERQWYRIVCCIF
jgi:hypothetical protein